MKGYTIQHSIELLEKEAGSGSGGASTASEVSFNNSGTGLVATNVQSAIGELVARDSFGSDEIIIGTRNGQPVYRKIIEFGALPNTSSKAVEHGIDNLDMTKVFKLSGTAARTATSPQVCVLPYVDESNQHGARLIISETSITVITSSDMSAFDTTHITIVYQKTAVTGSKKKK